MPAELRQQDHIEAGQEFEVERLDRGEYRLVGRTARPNEGVVDWLLACPEKGFFVPIDSDVKLLKLHEVAVVMREIEPVHHRARKDQKIG